MKVEIPTHAELAKNVKDLEERAAAITRANMMTAQQEAKAFAWDTVKTLQGMTALLQHIEQRVVNLEV